MQVEVAGQFMPLGVDQPFLKEAGKTPVSRICLARPTWKAQSQSSMSIEPGFFSALFFAA